jgi:hypothetical protein
MLLLTQSTYTLFSIILRLQNLNTKNVLMLVVLSAGMLAGLTATAIQATPAYAETDDCEDNDDNNCNESNERTQRIIQENECKAENHYGDNSGGNTGNDNKFVCTNSLVDPNTGDNAFNILVP